MLMYNTKYYQSLSNLIFYKTIQIDRQAGRDDYAIFQLARIKLNSSNISLNWKETNILFFFGMTAKSPQIIKQRPQGWMVEDRK